MPKKTLSVAHLVAAQWLKWVDASGIPQPYTFGFTRQAGLARRVSDTQVPAKHTAHSEKSAQIQGRGRVQFDPEAGLGMCMCACVCVCQIWTQRCLV